MEHKKKYGQYFTKNKILQKKLVEFIQNNPKCILEPCVGDGHLIIPIKEKYSIIEFDMFEIDDKIPDFLINKNQVVFCDFLKHNIEKKYDTIIGNPPYVKTQKGNLYIDFIEKCFNLLNDNGELIFIVPYDFFKLTASSKIIKKMLNIGNFTHVFHPNNEKLFEDASIDIMIFRYVKMEVKTNFENVQTIFNDKLLFLNNSNGMITFKEYINNDVDILSKYFDIYVGIVSGKDEVFKNNNLGNIDVICGENNNQKFILIDKYPSENYYYLRGQVKKVFLTCQKCCFRPL